MKKYGKVSLHISFLLIVILIIFAYPQLICMEAYVVDESGFDAGFKPGDVFREYVWNGPYKNAKGWQRVTDPNAKNEGAVKYLVNPVNSIDIDDLDGAVKVQMVIEQWGGHAGTSGKMLRINSNEWIPVPESPFIGPSKPINYSQFKYPVVEIPLNQIKTGTNTFEFTSGPQIAHNFNWGQWGVYSVTFRIFYDSAKPHVEGRVASVVQKPGNPEQVALSVDTVGNASRVDYIACYEDFDFDGDGISKEWQFSCRYGEMQHHIGTVVEKPFAVSWDTSWIPDQEQPVSIIAKITGENGICWITPAVSYKFPESRVKPVKLFIPYKVSQKWQTRDNMTQGCKTDINYDLANAESARMIMATWSGEHADEIGANGQMAVERVGLAHDYSYDEVDIPVAMLKNGVNELYTKSATEEHGIEVMWPGIVLKVRYNGKAVQLPDSADKDKDSSEDEIDAEAERVLLSDFEEGLSGWKTEFSRGVAKLGVSGDTPDGSMGSAEMYCDSTYLQYMVLEVNGAEWKRKGATAISLWIKWETDIPEPQPDMLKFQLMAAEDIEDPSSARINWGYRIGDQIGREWKQITIPFELFTSNKAEDTGTIPIENVVLIRILANSRPLAPIPVTFWVDNIELIP